MPGMFRGSGHNSGISDSDDSYYSSSDEDSLSDSPERRFPLRPEHDITEPRKVTLVRDALDTAYHMVAMVSEPRMDVSQLGFKPWKALGQALKTIGENGNDSRVSSVLDMEALVPPLLSCLQHDVTPLANSKQYTRTLSKDEARATYLVLKQWPTLAPYSKDFKGTTLAISKWLLLQLFRFRLAPQPVLTLTNLYPGSLEDVDEVAFSESCSLLKIQDGLVVGLDLTGNGLTALSLAFLHTFTHLQGLALSHNPIEWLPISILRLPLRRLKWSGSHPKPPPDTPRIRGGLELAQYPRPPRHRSLVQYSLMVLDRSFTLGSDLLDLDSTPRIAELLTKSYKCEICEEMCAIRSEDWMERQKLQWESPGAGWVGIEGRICRSCLVWLTLPDAEQV